MYGKDPGLTGEMLDFRVDFRYRLFGVRFLSGEGMEKRAIQGFPFLTKWQTEKPSVTGIVKGFFPTC
jgi:hypothetical protein